MIFEAGQQGDELALEIFRRMGVYLGIGLANLINILNPEMIVIGGGVVNGWDLFEKHMHQQVEERAFPLLRVKIVRAKCGDDAGLLGAARLAFKVICVICGYKYETSSWYSQLFVRAAHLLFAQDITTLEKIGPVISLTKSDKTVTLNCQDNSQVQLTILAPDLIRVRASFTKPIPSKDHSWAIAKQDWPTPRWNLSETSDLITITTDELEVVIRRSPLLIEFRDARTHRVLNADERPMSYDAQGRLNSMMFDPKAGMFVAASKKLGFDEHFYGLGEKASRLDKRRSSFVNWNSDTPGYTEGKDPIYQTIPFYIGLAARHRLRNFFRQQLSQLFQLRPVVATACMVRR